MIEDTNKRTNRDYCSDFLYYLKLQCLCTMYACTVRPTQVRPY